MDRLALLYNLLVFVADLAALVILARSRTTSTWLKLFLVIGATAVLLPLLLANQRLVAMRLAAYGAFVHATFGLAATAWLFWHSRRTFAAAAGIGAAVMAAIAVDAFVVEPQWLEVTRFRVESEKVRQPIRLVVLADLQANRFGDYEKSVLERTLEQRPDLILLAGDYFQGTAEEEKALRQEANAFLHKIAFSAPRGVFAVRGNVDSRRWRDTFDGLPIETVESTQSFELDDLRITCLGVRDSFDSNLEITAPTSTQFHIVLGHAPNYSLGDVEGDLLLAGHTHGGQVRLPWIGPLVTLSQVPRQWAAGMTELSGGGKLLVSRGIGMERDGAPPVRFLCRPQLVVIELVPKKLREKASRE